jgi:hypothetical protein
MSEKSSGGIELTPKTEDVADIAANLPTDDQKEIPKQNGRFIIAMIPMRKKPLPQSPTEK